MRTPIPLLLPSTLQNIYHFHTKTRIQANPLWPIPTMLSRCYLHPDMRNLFLPTSHIPASPEGVIPTPSPNVPSKSTTPNLSPFPRQTQQLNQKNFLKKLKERPFILALVTAEGLMLKDTIKHCILAASTQRNLLPLSGL